MVDRTEYLPFRHCRDVRQPDASGGTGTPAYTRTPQERLVIQALANDSGATAAVNLPISPIPSQEREGTDYIAASISAPIPGVDPRHQYSCRQRWGRLLANDSFVLGG